jgi:adenylosuccinate lyase
MMGRTHGIHAEPTTFGLKLALWYDEMGRQLQRFNAAAADIGFGKISGAVGTYANIDPFVERYVCESLGLQAAPISTQTLQRDRHAHYMSTLALIATSVEKFATEIRSLQKSEVREVEEYFSPGQTGSSAMPHKRNPIGSENVTGLARVMRGYMLTAYENVSLWHERDISHSSAERIIIPAATTLLNYMLNRFTKIMKELTVFPEMMQKNMDHSLGLVFSQQVMLALIDQGLTREEAYEVVQPLAMDAWSTQDSFLLLVQASTRVGELLSEEAIRACFDPRQHLKHVDLIFERLGL